MIEKLANRLTEQIGLENLANSDMKEYYVYGIVTFIEKWITILTIIAISLICNVFVPTLLFLIFFFALRKRTGGYHANQFWQCYIGTTATYIGIVIISPVLIEHTIIMYSMVICAAIVIMAIGTINHPNMALCVEELIELKKAARYVLLMESMIFMVFVSIGAYAECIAYMSMAIILCGGLLCLAKILRQEV